jgi:hypothetical protein
VLSLLALILSLQDETVVTVEKLRELEASVPPIVERATGKKFAKLPALGVAKRDEVVSVLAEELVPQLKLQYPVLGDETIRGEAKSMARQYARILLAKYSAKHHRIYVLPDTFRELAKRFGRPEIHSAEYLRMIVLHEYVHALDEEQYRAASKLQEMKSTGELEIWNALVEGHAQYVTHRILRSEDQEKLFLDFEDRIAAAPEAEGEADKYLASVELRGRQGVLRRAREVGPEDVRRRRVHEAADDEGGDPPPGALLRPESRQAAARFRADVDGAEEALRG